MNNKNEFNNKKNEIKKENVGNRKISNNTSLSNIPINKKNGLNPNEKNRIKRKLKNQNAVIQNYITSIQNSYTLLLFIPFLLFLFVIFYYTFGKQVRNINIDTSKNYWFSYDPTMIRNRYDCGCFPNHVKVHLENKKEEDIGNIKIGDKILSYNTEEKKYEYVPVVFVPHIKTEESYSFLKIHLRGKDSIIMTENHYVPIFFMNEIHIKKASELKIGDILFRIDPLLKDLSFSTVQKIENE